jgi:DNA helicase-2/ATP-dependent DNA helicase PcrA
MPSRFLGEIPPTVLSGGVGVRVDAPGDRSLDYSVGQAEEGGATVGMRVRHPVFGLGTILGVSGSGIGQKLRIRFERAGVKTIAVRYANLELG